MNTKGFKFLAVLAVMVMAFAAVFALAPSDNDSNAINVVKDFKDAQIDPIEITGAMTTSGTGYTKFYISDDMTVKIRALTDNITIYVQNGKELELDFKADPGYAITILSVTSDLEQMVTSMNTSAAYPAGDTNGGKLVIDGTELTFIGEKGQTVTYKALMPASVKTVYKPTTSTSASSASFETTVKTATKSGVQMYATISSDRSLGAATIGSLITIAPGQYIEVTNTAGVATDAFGIRITDADASTTTTYYYASNTDAGSFTMDDSDDAVLVQSGTITVKNGSSSVKANSLYYSSLTVTPTSSENGVTLNGLVSGGTVVASGDLTFSSAFAIGTATYASGVVTIANNSTVNTSTAAVYGSLIVKNDNIENLTATGTGIIKADNIKLWNYDEPASPKVKFVDGGFSGQVDISSITETAEVKERFATANIVENQTFSVVDDTTVTTALLVEGVLIVNPGVTLTIYKLNTSGAAITMTGQYAQIINYGDIVIKTTKGSSYAPNVGLQVNGGMFLNYGRIAGSSDSTDKGPTLRVDVENGYGFENNGTVTMSKNDAVAFSNGFTNNGSMTINSKISVESGAVKNAGSFVLNNAEVDESITIDTVSGADVSIAAILGNGEFVEVKHGSNSVKIEAPDTLDTGTLTVRGIAISDVSTLSTTSLDLSGAMGVTKSATVPTDANWYPTLTIAGGVKVTGSAIIPENFKTNTTAAKITVSGDLTLAKKAGEAVTDAAAGLELTVDGGKVVSLEGDRFTTCTKYTAAKYSYTSGTTIYTTFEDAVEDAIANYVPTVEVGNVSATSYVTVTDDVVIPAGMTIIGHKIAIGDSKHSPLVGLETTAGFNIDDITLVSGMIAAENMNDVDDSAIKADVKEVNEETYGVTYMSLDVALLAYAAGGVIELNQDVVITDDTLVIPAGVEINSMEDEYALVLINSDLIVNGTVATEPFYFVATVDDTKSITVNGYMIDKHEDGECITGHWFTPIGVSYRYTEVDDYGNEETYYIITSLDNLQPAINIADEAKVTVEGNPKLGDLTITGRDDMPAEVTFNGNIDAGTLTLDDVTIIAKQDNKVNATFKNALGSITITGAYVKSKEMSIYTLDEGPVTMTGAITDGTASTYSIRFDGMTGIDGATSGAVIGWGNYVDEDGDYFSYPAILFNGTTVATGKKVLIQNNIADEADRSNAGIVTITGSLIADNGNKLTIVADTEVLGGLVALEKTDEATAGSIAVEGHLFVGALMSDIYSANDALAAYHEEIGGTWTISEYGKSAHLDLDAAAILSGKISVSESCFITAMVGSLIDDAIIEDLDSLDVLIDGDVWLTVYGSSNAPYSLDGLKAPIVNAAVTEIVDADDNAVALFSQKYKVIYGSAQKPLSQYGEVFINLDYEVFAVKIKTDGSVKAVYVDGILMETGNVANIFMIYKQATGTHKVTVEPATGYTADGCVLYTEMGTILPGMAFTFTEYDCEFVVSEDFTGYLVTYDIKGTAVEPEPVPPTPEEESQWTITTILLVILVVLIAIMAVIVALRLNRS